MGGRHFSRRWRTCFGAGSVLAALLLIAPATMAAATAAPSAAPIPSSQPLAGAAYIGAPAAARRLPPTPPYFPLQSLMHADAGNTNTSSFPGPLGYNPTVTTFESGPLLPMMWDLANRLTTGCAEVVSGVPATCLAAVDPSTLAVQARWFPPDPGQQLNLAYVAMTAFDTVVVPTRQGRIYVVQRHDGPTGPSFTTIRDMDLIGQGVIGPSELLLATLFDARGNIWFTTGGILGNHDNPAPFTTFGYIDPAGGVHSVRIPGQIVENGIAVNLDTMYMVTGPAPSTTGTVGYMGAFTAGPGGTVQTVWQQSYDAGRAMKPGGFARGSGSTPTLVNHQYVAITDNADNQIHLNVYRLGPLWGGASRQVCSVPLFTPGASANDIGTIGFNDGFTDGVVALNDYNAPSIGFNPLNPNSLNNNVNQMAPGIERVNISPWGRCSVAWDNQDVRIKSVPFLSTRTGLIYGYTQDPNLAAQGEYVWYAVAVDAKTGQVVWQVRTGAGGTFNDSYSPGSLGPDGTFYQGVPLGVIEVKDAPH